MKDTDCIWQEMIKPFKTDLAYLAIRNKTEPWRKSWFGELFKPSPFVAYLKRESIMSKIKRKEKIDEEDKVFIEQILKNKWDDI